MKTIKLFCIILGFFLFSGTMYGQSIAITIDDANYVSTDYYTFTGWVVKDMSTFIPTTICLDSPGTLLNYPTDNPGISCGLTKDVTAKIFQIRIRVKKNNSVERDGVSALLNSDDFYAGNTPVTVTF